MSAVVSPWVSMLVRALEELDAQIAALLERRRELARELRRLMRER